MPSIRRVAWITLLGVVLLALPARAQLQLGDLSSNLNGVVSAGYAGDYGNQVSSDHGWQVGGSGTLSGFYYNPNFISFTASPYVNQSRSNSNFQSISDASGVNFSSNIFGGTHFPGSISYSKAYNSEGNYAIPGVSNFTTHGESDTLGMNWSENLPDAPSLSVGFQMGSSQYSVYGTDDQGQSNFRSFNVHSAYKLLGFGLGAYYSTGESTALIPQVVSGESAAQTQSSSSNVGLSLSHVLPLAGSFNMNFNRSNFGSDYLGSSTNGTIDVLSGAASVHPINKLSLSVSGDYSDNLAGQLAQSVVSAGGIVTGLNTNQSSSSMDMVGTAAYAFLPNLQTTLFAERRAQYYEGTSYGQNSYGGSATYAHGLLGGTFNAALSASDNTVDNSDLNALGLSTTVSYNRRIEGWNVTGSFGYAQNVQTLLITYMSSYYSYSGNVRRRFGRFNVGAGATASQTGLTEVAGSSSKGEGYNASFGYGRFFTLSGTYNKALGDALATGSGLVVQSQPLPVTSLLTVYGGTGYSVGVGSSPVKKLTIGASFSKADSNITSSAVTSWSQNEQFNAIFQYQFRKVYLNGGFDRLQQGFSTSGLPPEVISSFYIGVSRWFNFF